MMDDKTREGIHKIRREFELMGVDLNLTDEELLEQVKYSNKIIASLGFKAE
jgi:hypothetical protein